MALCVTSGSGGIIQLQVGGCGNALGVEFWKTIGKEHGIDLAGKQNKNMVNSNQKTHVYYREVEEHKSQKFIPRAVFIDLDPVGLDTIRTSSISKLCDWTNSAVMGSCSTTNNWAKGHYTDGVEILDEILDVIRHTIEYCDWLQGFQLFHSIGGGTGSGLGSCLMRTLKDDYPDRLVTTFTVFPYRGDILNSTVNALMSIHYLIDDADNTFVVDNKSLFDITENLLKLPQTNYSDFNWISSMAISSATGSFRFKTELNNDLRRMCTNLNPFPRLHFLSLSHAPIFQKGKRKDIKITMKELNDQLWSSNSSLSSIDCNNGKYMTTSCVYRGKMNPNQMTQFSNISLKMSNDFNIKDTFIEWIPKRLKYRNANMIVDGYSRMKLNGRIIPISIVDLCQTYIGSKRLLASHDVDIKFDLFSQPSGLCENQLCGTLITNTTAIKDVMNRISEIFRQMWKRKTFLHLYKAEGMDQMEFEEAHQNINDLIWDYQDKEYMTMNKIFNDIDGFDEESDDNSEEEEDLDTDEIDGYYGWPSSSSSIY